MTRVCAVFLSCVFVLFLCCVFVPAAHSGAAGSGWIPDSRVVNVSYPTDESFVSPAIGADSLGNLYAACREYSPFGGYWYLTTSKSSDGGRTWNFTGSGYLGGNTMDLCLAVADKGDNQVLIAYEANGTGICLERMLQDGSSTNWCIVSSPHAHNPQLVLDNSLPIYAYLVYENDSSGVPGDSDIYFTRSTDYSNNWTTWDAPYALAGASDTLTHANPTIAYGSGGHLYVAFERAGEIYVMHNTNFGNRVDWGYTPGTLVSPSTGWSKGRPRLAASHTAPGTVVVTWEEEYSLLDYDIGYTYSTDTGITWNSSAIYLARTFADERKPVIAADYSGLFHFAYWSGSDDGARVNAIIYRWSSWTDPGVWTDAEQVMDDNGHAYESYNQPAIAAQERGGATYPVIAWTDLRSSPPDVYCTTRGATCTILSEPSTSGGLPVVQVDGKSYATPASFVWPAGLGHVLNAPSPQEGAGFRYLYAGWSDTGSQFHEVLAGTSDITITASFVIQYELVVSTDPVFLDPQPIVSPAGPWYYVDAVVNITPQRVIGSYSLDHWTVDGADFPPYEMVAVAMTQPHNVVAKYGLDTTAPMISNLVQDPAGPQVAPGQSVDLQVTVMDSETGVKNVTLRYRTSTDNATWSGWMTESMSMTGVDAYAGTIVGYGADTYVQYVISAFDYAENSRVLPETLYFDYFVVPEFSSFIVTAILLSSAAALLLTMRWRSPFVKASERTHKMNQSSSREGRS